MVLNTHSPIQGTTQLPLGATVTADIWVDTSF